MHSNPHFFLPFYLPAYDGRLGHVYFSIPYAMHACIHVFVDMHRARYIMQTASVFQFQIEYVIVVAFHMPCLGLAEPALNCISVCVALAT